MNVVNLCFYAEGYYSEASYEENILITQDFYELISDKISELEIYIPDLDGKYSEVKGNIEVQYFDENDILGNWEREDLDKTGDDDYFIRKIKNLCDEMGLNLMENMAKARDESAKIISLKENFKPLKNKFNPKKTKEAIIRWLKIWFFENGKDCNAVIGISGGCDSSVVAALCVEALGKGRVFGVLMPNGTQNDISDSYKLVEHLGIDYTTINIHNAFISLKHEIRPALNDKWSTHTSINLAPRLRMATLYAVSQTLNGRVSNNSNLSERWLGYYTRWADNVGDFSPLGNLTKTEVIELGKELGLPEELVNKVPSDGLCGKTDEDNFGFTYNVLDRYIRTGEIEDQEAKKKIDEMHQKNLFKLQLMPSFKLEEK